MADIPPPVYSDLRQQAQYRDFCDGLPLDFNDALALQQPFPFEEWLATDGSVDFMAGIFQPSSPTEIPPDYPPIIRDLILRLPDKVGMYVSS